MNGILLVYECNLSNYYTYRCWGRMHPTRCDKICLNFLHSQAVGIVECQNIAIAPVRAQESP